MNTIHRGRETRPGGSPGPPSGARPRRRARWGAPGGRVCHGARAGTEEAARSSPARRSDVAPPPPFIPWAHHLWEDPLGSGTQPHGWQRRSRVCLDGPDPDGRSWFWGHKTSLWGKEPKLVREVERYQLDLVGLSSTHHVSALVLYSWIGVGLFSGVSEGMRCRAGVGILINPWQSAAVL